MATDENVKTETVFTQGPWHVVGRAEEFSLAVCAPRPGNEARLDSVLGDENAEANARLIAAAPELYAAVEAVDRLMSGEKLNKSSVLAKVRAALAKARVEA